MIKNNRRQFIKKTCLAAGIAISPLKTFTQSQIKLLKKILLLVMEISDIV